MNLDTIKKEIEKEPIISIEGIPIEKFTNEEFEYYFRQPNLFISILNKGKSSRDKEILEMIDKVFNSYRFDGIFTDKKVEESINKIKKELQQKIKARKIEE